VVGTAGDSTEAIRLVEEGARVLVVDPRLPELADGQALVERVTASWPEVQIVIMGWGEAGDSRIARGAKAFVAKSVPPEEFVAATLAACGY
jgi:DNA-binding NarL/FixJ family response regulator